MKQLLRGFHSEERAQDMLEYALIALFIGLGAIAGMSTLAGSINAEFIKIAGKLS